MRSWVSVLRLQGEKEDRGYAVMVVRVTSHGTVNQREKEERGHATMVVRSFLQRVQRRRKRRRRDM